MNEFEQSINNARRCLSLFQVSYDLNEQEALKQLLAGQTNEDGFCEADVKQRKLIDNTLCAGRAFTQRASKEGHGCEKTRRFLVLLHERLDMNAVKNSRIDALEELNAMADKIVQMPVDRGISFNELAAKEARYVEAERAARESIMMKGRARDEYVAAWRMLRVGLDEWVTNGSTYDLHGCVNEFSVACEKWLGDDWLTNVQDFSPEVFDDDPFCKTQAIYIAVVIEILASCQIGSCVDLPSHNLENLQYLTNHIGYAKDLVEAGSPEAFYKMFG